VPLAQLDRASDYESEGREFESLRARQGKAAMYRGFSVFMGVNPNHFPAYFANGLQTFIRFSLGLQASCVFLLRFVIGIIKKE
jgi:hypothetical protein